jgi:enoyl-[acyl-carrier-protein] reductase (NADH)
MLGVNSGLAKSDGEHGDVSLEFKVIKTFFNRLVLINNSDIWDFIVLMKLVNSVLDELSQLDCVFHSIGNTLDNNGVLTLDSASEEFISSSQISANTRASLNSDFILRKFLLSLFYSKVLFCHLKSNI